MPESLPAGRRRAHRWLSATLVAGALYDIFFASLMLALPEAAGRWFALPLPEPRFYLRILAVLLLMLGALYLVAARDPERARGIVAVAIVGRLAGAAIFAFDAASTPAHAALWPLAIGDGAFGLAHLVTARGLLR